MASVGFGMRAWTSGDGDRWCSCWDGLVFAWNLSFCGACDNAWLRSACMAERGKGARAERRCRILVLWLVGHLKCYWVERARQGGTPLGDASERGPWCAKVACHRCGARAGGSGARGSQCRQWESCVRCIIIGTAMATAGFHSVACGRSKRLRNQGTPDSRQVEEFWARDRRFLLR